LGTVEVTVTTNGGTSATSSADQFTYVVGPAAQLAFTVPPVSTVLYEPITPAVKVAVQDSQGNVVTNATNAITIAIASGFNMNDATLRGTTTASADGTAGVATFSSLALDQPGSGYQLQASSAG